MLSDLAVFYTEQIIVGCGSAAKGSLGYRKTVIFVRKHHIGLVVDHLDALLRESRESLAQARETVGDSGIVLDILIAVEIIGGVVGILSAENIAYKIRDDLACGFFIGAVLFERAVDLSAP